MLGHEGRGSLAALLRGAGLVQDLTTGLFDEVRNEEFEACYTVLV